MTEPGATLGECDSKLHSPTPHQETSFLGHLGHRFEEEESVSRHSELAHLGETSSWLPVSRGLTCAWPSS